MALPPRSSRAPVTQLELEFETRQDRREAERQARLARILNTVPKVSTAARMFDDAAYCEATRLAEAYTPDPP